jgi:hypothetical protein
MDCDKAKAKKWRAANKERAKKSLKEWKSRNPSFAKKKRLKPYGLSIADYDAMLLSQGGLCAICRGPFVGSGHVDHCHPTKRVRGILCIPCNLGIGHLKEGKAIMERAIAYLAPVSD